MRKVILGLAVLVLIFGLGSTKLNAQTVVTFDDLPGSTGVVPNGYGGINWNGNWTYYGGGQYPYTPESAPNRVYTGFASASFNFLTPEVFNGAYFAGYGYATISYQLYDGSTLVYSSLTSYSPSATPGFFSSGYSGAVTEVIINSPYADYYVMDNVTYSPLSATPEPGSFLLFGTGLLASFILIFRKWTR
jgi:hypothetical protein